MALYSMMGRQKLVVVSGALIRMGQKFLLAQRRHDVRFALLWEFPGGRIEAHETPEQCVVREMKEELGLLVKPLRLAGTFEDELPDLKIFVYLYECEITSGSPQCLECENWGWFSLSKIKDLSLAPLDQKIFTWLKDDECHE